MAILDNNLPGSAGDPIVRTGFSQGQSYPVTGTIHERIAQVVSQRFETGLQHVKGKFERFYRYEKILNMISKKKQYEWKANAYLPYGLAVAEQSAALKCLTLLRDRPLVNVQSRQAGLEGIADHREALLEYRFFGDIDIINAASEMFRIAERYGKAVALVAPDWDHKILRYRAAVNLPTVYGPLARMTWKTTQERAYKIRFEPLDLTTFVPQPGYRRINGPGGMHWCCRYYDLTFDELVQMQQEGMVGPLVGGEDIDKVRTTVVPDINEFKARRLFMDKYDDYEYWRDKFDRTVELVEYQGRVPDELIDPQLAEMEEQAGLDPKQRLMILANRKTVMVNQALPWDHRMKSYVEMDCITDPYGFWGVGKVEPIEHLIYTGNEIVNMRLDNVKAAINGIIGVHGNRMPPGWKTRLVSQPWGVVETEGPPNEVIQRLQLGDVTQSSYQEQSQVFGLIQEASAINETMLGAPGGAVRTLGEHQLKADMGTRRLNFELMVQVEQLLSAKRGLVAFILGLDRQYMPLPQYVSVIDPMEPDGFTEIQLNPMDLADDDENFVYITSAGAQSMLKDSKRMDLIQLAGMIAPQLPLMAQLGFNVIEWWKYLFRGFDADPNLFFPKMIGTMAPDAMGIMAGAAGGAPMGPPAGPGMPGMQPQNSSPQRPGGRNGGAAGPAMPPQAISQILSGGFGRAA